jgi:WD40 repeat protein
MTGSKPSTGPTLVGRALGSLAYTYERLDLSEDELLDALTADEETWASTLRTAAASSPAHRTAPSRCGTLPASGPLRSHRAQRLGEVTAVTYSPDGTRMASGSDDTTLKVWDAASGAELATLSGHTDRVVAVAYSPDGARSVSGSFDQTSKLWDTQTMECVGMLSYSGWVSGCDFSPLGTRVFCGDDGGGCIHPGADGVCC